MDLIASAQNVQNTQDQISLEPNASKTHALTENTSHWQEHAFHVNHVWLPFQDKLHATIQTVELEILSLKMVPATLAQFSKNQAPWLLNVVLPVLSVPHLRDNALKRMEIVLHAQITLDVKEIVSITVMELDNRVSNNVDQISVKWEKSWWWTARAQNAQTTLEVLVPSNKANIPSASHVLQRKTKLFEKMVLVDHAIHSRKLNQVTEDASCQNANQREPTS
jgi:hypothetical protein